LLETMPAAAAPHAATSKTAARAPIQTRTRLITFIAV
jgi:hypothetical protein